MKIDVFDLTGNKAEEITLPKAIFEAKINEILMAQAVRIYQGNQRMASAKTLTRAGVNRTTKKVYRQKGTGQARHGSRKAPIYVGGGVALGPTGEQNYKLTLPKKMRIAALKSSLSLFAKNKQMILVKDLNTLEKPSTKNMAKLLNKLIAQDKQRNIVLVLENEMQTAQQAWRNIPSISIINSQELTTFDVVKSHWLIIALDSVKKLEERLTKSK